MSMGSTNLHEARGITHSSYLPKHKGPPPNPGGAPFLLNLGFKTSAKARIATWKMELAQKTLSSIASGKYDC